MAITAVLGAQWGDEGKGKIVDYLATDSDMVIRFQGGDNAGHTVINEYGEFRLHLIPSGIFNPNTSCLIGTGVVVNPISLVNEMNSLAGAHVGLDRLMVADRAHLVMPYHVALDRAEESFRKSKIGTTMRGIGPAYADKVGRFGIQVFDSLDQDYFAERVRVNVERVNLILSELYGAEALSADDVLDQVWPALKAVRPHVVDCYAEVRKAMGRGDRILLEGQLGAMRDLDWGAYPYVTSSNPIAGGASVGAGIPPALITRVVGVVKAYSTCVGEGPMPTELNDEMGERLRRVGGEYGATTGRPRRCGWFDAVAVRYSSGLSGFTDIAVTKLDVMGGIERLKMATAYRVNTRDGEVIRDTPPPPALMGHVTPIYEEHEGWCSDISNVRSSADLPAPAMAYLRRIEELCGARIGLVSVGPRREQTFSAH